MAVFKEKILLARLKNKDKDAFAQMYDLFVDQIYRFIYFKVGSKEEAEDLTSIVFLKIWNFFQEPKAEDAHTTLKPLLYKIARNTVIDHYRKKNWGGSISLDTFEAIQVKDERQNVVQHFEARSDFEFIQVKLGELKDEYREVILLRFVHELSIAEIARVMGKPKGTVRVQIYRALKALRELVK